MVSYLKSSNVNEINCGSETFPLSNASILKEAP
jgi:hypothetical protein